jgi:hypothetical protein
MGSITAMPFYATYFPDAAKYGTGTGLIFSSVYELCFL